VKYQHELSKQISSYLFDNRTEFFLLEIFTDKNNSVSKFIGIY